MNSIVETPKPQDLGPAQLCWLRDKIASFAEAHDAAEKAQIHTAQIRATMPPIKSAA